MEARIDIKPLSVNEAWQGRRFKTDAYESYERACLFLLPQVRLPAPPFAVFYEFGFSNVQSDLGNPEKCISDIIQKKYGINDRDFMEIHLRKRIVKRGKEYINIRIEHWTDETSEVHDQRKTGGRPCAISEGEDIELR